MKRLPKELRLNVILGYQRGKIALAGEFVNFDDCVEMYLNQQMREVKK